MSVTKISCGLTEWVISMGVAFAAPCWSVKYLLTMLIAVDGDGHRYGYTCGFSMGLSLGMGTGHKVWTCTKTCTRDYGYGQVWGLN